VPERGAVYAYSNRGGTQLNRRHFIEGSLIAAAGVLVFKSKTTLVHASGTDSAALKSLAKPCGMFMGAAVEPWMFKNPQLCDILIANFNLIAPGNAFKWTKIRPTPEVFDFANVDFMMQFAQDHAMRVHATTLCWNSNNPGWLERVLTKSNARQYLVDHITHVASRYAGKLDSWDVVNEPVAVWHNRPGGLYPGPWLDLLGPEYIDIAFHTVAAADPKAIRVLNIHHVEQDDPGGDPTRAACMKLIKGLLRRDVPVQAIGIESHLLPAFSRNSASFRRFVRELSDLGLRILISELDVDDTKVRGDVAMRDKVVAECYSEYLTAVLSTIHPERILLWSFADKSNWFDWIPEYKRPDGLPHRPGLFDEHMSPKASYGAMLTALRRGCS
jgi:endo-1,4-beta-xylanase